MKARTRRWDAINDAGLGSPSTKANVATGNDRKRPTLVKSGQSNTGPPTIGVSHGVHPRCDELVSGVAQSKQSWMTADDEVDPAIRIDISRGNAM